ncbi:MAG: ATP-dependent helicase [Firmicutes bacterium]|nr:ATP-dependent helicase [Bacillota bacterium]
MRFRPGQDKVAGYKGGFLAVPAIPGAGKTTVLSWLAARLISEGLPRGGKILVVTVMNSAVANFNHKIGDWLETRNLPRHGGFEVRTLHSLAMQVIRERPAAAGLRDDFVLVDGAQREQMLRSIVDQWIDNNPERWQAVLKIDKSHGRFENVLEHWRTYTHNLARELVSHFKSSGIKPGDNDDDGFLGWAWEFYGEYCRQLTRSGMLDFDDLLLKACTLVESDDQLSARLADKWPFIFEDEAQDSNPLQQRLLLKLAQQHGNLVRVGDSNQAIMGTFTNSDPSLFRDFCRHPDVRLEPMLQSSRSSRDIISLANELVRWSNEQHPVDACRQALETNYIEPVAADDPDPNPSPAGYTLAVRAYADQEQEIAGICKHASEYIERRPEHTVAILAPTNFLVTRFREHLEAMATPCYEITTYPAGRRKTIDDLQAIIAALASPGNSQLLAAALERLLPELIDEPGLKEYLETIPPEQLLFGYGWPQSLVEHQLWELLKPRLGQFRSWLEARHLPPDMLLLEIAVDLGLQDQELAIAQKMALDIKFRLTLYPNWRLPEISETLIQLTHSFLGAANLFYERAGYRAEPGVVNLVTAHRAKGLEWDTVYVVGLTAGNYPGLMADKIRSEYGYLPEDLVNPVAVAKAQFAGADPRKAVLIAKEELLAERLRLLYVAITRARMNLLLTWHRKNDYGRKQKPALPIVHLQKFMEVEARGRES